MAKEKKRPEDLTVADSWQALHRIWDVCERCDLSKSRRNVVFGMGKPESIMVVGQFPGRDEDRDGVPFKGIGGARTAEALNEARIKWEDCFFDNCLGCQPPSGKQKQAQVDVCRWRLVDTVNIIKPRLIVACGTVATTWFSGTQWSLEVLGATRGEYEGIPVYYCTHPLEPYRRSGDPNAVERSVLKVRREWQGMGRYARELEIVPRLDE